MDFTQLRAFIAVAEEGNLTRAADRLHVTQPAVSLQIKLLQERLKLQLFVRTSAGMRLTNEGSKLLPVAERVLNTLQEFHQHADALHTSAGTLSGTLSLGTILDPEFTRLGPFVRSLTASAQRTEVFLRYGMSDDVLTQIGTGELDVGYYVDATPDPTHPVAERLIEEGKFHLMPLMSYVYRVIAPGEWSERVMGKGWADLAGLPWLATPAKSAHRRMLDDIFRPLGPLPKRVAYTDQEEAMTDFVESGVCLSLARDPVIERITRERNFVIADKVTLTCDLSFACLTSRRQEPTIAHAFTAMQAVWDLNLDKAPARSAGA